MGPPLSKYFRAVRLMVANIVNSPELYFHRPGADFTRRRLLKIPDHTDPSYRKILVLRHFWWYPPCAEQHSVPIIAKLLVHRCFNLEGSGAQTLVPPKVTKNQYCQNNQSDRKRIFAYPL